jgi:urea carboxylase
MEGPGGYQLVGRTIQMWNSWRTTEEFAPGKPWLLRFFDQIRFFPVSADELAEAREAFPYGRYKLRVEETVFRARDYADFLAHEAQNIGAFQAAQRAAFEAERQRWKAAGLDRAADDDVAPEPPPDALLPGETGVFSPVPGTVWKIEVAAGCHVEQGQALLILESMKMEMRVNAPVAGTLVALRCQLGGAVMSGQLVAVIVPGGTGSSPA